ncbi:MULTISPECIES: RagB/SusD family nutrient uptake outer membrane protein [unclassified Empedobacter]|uniref:RagB/SusD family nutrient uptake outer membrane protein n=1 Tax=unclassified Empedobacter TaxID=2643773 RepID=UPI0025BC629D|nr:MULTISPECIES: RagB/SusD family nutrient uptake outer membrane protein [unclassified Empedobacter]
MKKTILILATLMLGSSTMLTSCADDFLDTIPTSEIGDETAYSTGENLMTIINGMHRNMYVRQNSSQGQNGYTAQLIVSDVLGDDVVFPSTGNGWFVSTLRWLDINNESSGNIAYPWNFWYSMMRNANNVITYGQDAGGNQTLKNNAIGQAYAYRAFGYFQLVQLYANRYEAGKTNSQLGVVIRLDPSPELMEDPKERSTVEEVYKQIWSDLDQAEKQLTGISKLHNSHFSLDNVQGLKARVALVQQDYAKAAQYAKEARGVLTLMTQTQYKAGFNDYTNPEWMWGVKIISDQTDYFGNFHAYMSRNYNSTQIRTAPKVMNTKLYNAFPSTDVRVQVVDPTGKHTSLGLPSNYSLFAYTSQKFLSESTASSLGDVPFMRVAEMYLIEAEALYKLGKEADSKTVLSTLVKARDTSFTTFTTTGDAYYQQILLNRRLELWGEGFRFYDLKRLGQKLDRTGANHNTTVINNVYTIEASDNRWQWVIPQAEINSNPLLKQNPS